MLFAEIPPTSCVKLMKNEVSKCAGRAAVAAVMLFITTPPSTFLSITSGVAGCPATNCSDPLVSEFNFIGDSFQSMRAETLTTALPQVKLEQRE